MKIGESEIKYTIVGAVKTALTFGLLWYFIDYLEVKQRLSFRLGVIIFAFVATHYVFKKIGYAR